MEEVVIQAPPLPVVNSLRLSQPPTLSAQFPEHDEFSNSQFNKQLRPFTSDIIPIKSSHSGVFDPCRDFIYGGLGQGFPVPSTHPLSPVPITYNGYMRYGTPEGVAQPGMFLTPYYMPVYPGPQLLYSPNPGHFYPPTTYLQPTGSNYNLLAWQSSQLGCKMMMNKSKWEIHKRRNQQQQCMAEKISRTIYITDLDCSLTEENLAEFFGGCGEIVDVRVCGDPNCPQKFAFIEFTENYAAAKALQWSGQTLGKYVLKALPSKTAIIPVNKDYMPKNSKDMERCNRTIYVTNINKCIGKDELRSFFEALCGGEITLLRLLGDKEHPTRIAFVEFKTKECAAYALNVSGYTLSGVALRVAPSKTPVRVNESAQLRTLTSSSSPSNSCDGDYDPKSNVVHHKLDPTSPDFQPTTPPLFSQDPSFKPGTEDSQESYSKQLNPDNDTTFDTPTQENSTQN